MRGLPPGAPTYDELARGLADAEAALEAVAAGAVDALASGHGADAQITALERADSFFVTLVTEMQEAAASMNSGGTVLYANPRFAELLRVPMSRVLGRTLAELTAEAGRPAAQRLLAEAVRGPARGTLELLRGDGGLVPVQVSAAPIAGDQPEVCLVAADLTDLRQAESTMREAEERFRSAFDQAPIGMALLSLDGRFERVNAVMAAITGRPEAQLLGTPLASVLEHSHATALLSRLAGVPGGEQDSTTVEVCYLNADGRGVWVAQSATVIGDADGRAQQILLQVQDIEGQRLHKQQLERQAAIIAFTSESIVSVTPRGEIETCNPSATRLYGYANDELAGERFERLTAPAQREAVAEAFGRAVAGDQVGPLETIRLRKDGSTFDASVTLSPIRDASGEVVRVASVSQDISERKRTAAELQRVSDELARSNADLEQFAYVASHDLSEPLRTVTGFVQLLADRYAANLDDDAREFVAFAVSGTQRMQELLDGLLAYSRAGTMEQRLAEVDCGRTLLRVLSGLESSITDSGTQIDIGELPTVVADPTQIEQLFQNLLANAVKFRAVDGARIRISAEEELDRHVVSIADSGIGIDPEHRERIFKMFQQLHARDEYAGIGAGLAICRQITVRHGGQIWVEETPGGGSTFRFSLPKRSLP
jgi:PAS domain S-box-containing protein